MEYRFENEHRFESAESMESFNEIEQKLIDSVYELIRSREHFLGEGMTAEVHSLKDNPELCYKIIRTTDVMVRPDRAGELPEEYKAAYLKKMNPRNTTAEMPSGKPWYLNPFGEAELMDEVYDIDSPVTVPEPYVYLELRGKHDGDFFEVTDTLEILLMKRINGVTIRDIFEKKAALPESFDCDVFSNHILDFVNKMHERGVYHRDLHDGNVMINLNTSHPYVIDFGRGTKSSVEDAYKQEVGPNRVIHFVTDEQMLKSKVLGPLKEALLQGVDKH